MLNTPPSPVNWLAISTSFFCFVLFFERHLFWFFAHFLIGLFVRLLDSFASLTSERLDSFHSQLSGMRGARPWPVCMGEQTPPLPGAGEG